MFLHASRAVQVFASSDEATTHFAGEPDLQAAPPWMRKRLHPPWCRDEGFDPFGPDARRLRGWLGNP